MTTFRPTKSIVDRDRRRDGRRARGPARWRTCPSSGSGCCIRTRCGWWSCWWRPATARAVWSSRRPSRGACSPSSRRPGRRPPLRPRPRRRRRPRLVAGSWLAGWRAAPAQLLATLATPPELGSLAAAVLVGWVASVHERRERASAEKLGALERRAGVDGAAIDELRRAALALRARNDRLDVSLTFLRGVARRLEGSDPGGRRRGRARAGDGAARRARRRGAAGRAARPGRSGRRGAAGPFRGGGRLEPRRPRRRLWRRTGPWRPPCAPAWRRGRSTCRAAVPATAISVAPILDSIRRRGWPAPRRARRARRPAGRRQRRRASRSRGDRRMVGGGARGRQERSRRAGAPPRAGASTRRRRRFHPRRRWSRGPSPRSMVDARSSRSSRWTRPRRAAGGCRRCPGSLAGVIDLRGALASRDPRGLASGGGRGGGAAPRRAPARAGRADPDPEREDARRAPSFSCCRRRARRSRRCRSERAARASSTGDRRSTPVGLAEPQRVDELRRLGEALPCCEALISGSQEERRAIIATLTRRADADAVALLRWALGAPDPELAVEAALAIEEMTAAFEARLAESAAAEVAAAPALGGGGARLRRARHPGDRRRHRRLRPWCRSWRTRRGGSSSPPTTASRPGCWRSRSGGRGSSSRCCAPTRRSPASTMRSPGWAPTAGRRCSRCAKRPCSRRTRCPGKGPRRSPPTSTPALAPPPLTARRRYGTGRALGVRGGTGGVTIGPVQIPPLGVDPQGAP